MPLNKLDNFLKNVEGRILYVSPSDLDASDSITNQGNSQTRPFKTLQRALIEAARFSYNIGNNNDVTEKTTVLLMPGEHLIDNRPGFGILTSGGVKALTPGGAEVDANIFDLTLDSNFDLTQEDNVLYKFNSFNGGVIVPRGTSVVGLDLRKTKIRPKYVPNPLDNTPKTALFRITGACYFWQFSIFDGDENSLVYINSTDQAKPTFSHHKITCFEYADGVNIVDRTGIDDLNMYYYKLSVAYDAASTRNIQDKYPTSTQGFAKRRPEFEIVGAFASDPIRIIKCQAGDGVFADNDVTVTTEQPHGLDVGTPIKIRGVSPSAYNVSTKVSKIGGPTGTNDRIFEYTLSNFDGGLETPASNVTGANVTIETDTVSGASPYIFNISLRSVWGMNGMHADGSKATGFRSMVVAQFTGVSLQKDDRAFVKYSIQNGRYEGIELDPTETTTNLSQNSSSTNPSQIYHLDSEAIYRSEWETCHISITNDAVLQIVSVFAIGYYKHFSAESGGDASITNSNSNFGQFALISKGFKKDAFAKDDKAFLTHVITPKSITPTTENIDWLAIDKVKTQSVGVPEKLYLNGFSTRDTPPPSLTQGFRIGAKLNDKLFVVIGGITREAKILMVNAVGNPNITSVKEYQVNPPVTNIFTTVGAVTHQFITGEKVIVRSDVGELPESIEEDIVYFAIRVDNNSFKLASSKANADLGEAVSVYYGSNLRVLSRVTDKTSGDVGHPIEFDSNGWYINVNSVADGNTIFNNLSSVSEDKTEPTFVTRIPDNRNLDDKIYKFRISVPQEAQQSKNPETGFIIQESSNTGVRTDGDFTQTSNLKRSDFEFNRNLRYINDASYDGGTTKVTVSVDKPHNLSVNDTITIKNITSSDNTVGTANSGYNGTFTVSDIPNAMSFRYSPGRSLAANATNDFNVRTTSLPRFERTDLKSNVYLYRNLILSEYIDSTQDGVYHSFPLNANNPLPTQADGKGFSELEYSQNVVNFYPQLDRDNSNENPKATKTFSLAAPLGKVATNYPDRSLTKETVDKFVEKIGVGLTISSISHQQNASVITFGRNHNLSGITTGVVKGGSGYTAGITTHNVKVHSAPSTQNDSNWQDTLATVTTNGSGQVSSFKITNQGAGWQVGSRAYFNNASLGGGSGAEITSDGTNALVDSQLGANSNLVVQFTGSSTTDDLYYRITSVGAKNVVGIETADGDTRPTADQYAFIVGSSISANLVASGGIGTFTSTIPHGLVAGNKFQFNNSSNVNQGTFTVKSKISVSSFTIAMNINASGTIANGHILKHGFSANDAVSEKGNENLSIRGVEIFGGEIGIGTFSTVGSEDTLRISLTNSKSGITGRFPYGSYAQIDDEIVRIKSENLIGNNNDELQIIRGVLGTRTQTHDDGSLVKLIKPIPIEFHRPSILRASGHTFEYLGYGPGNYSTALPQVQVKTLTEQEEFLSQSQERSGGAVVYTGMNNKGDFYIGNQKKSSLTGEEVTFDTPIPSVAGEDPARLSVVFDEVTVKERIVVEGGKSNTALSQFDGPVTFNNEVRIKDSIDISGRTKFSNTSPAVNPTDASVVFNGGIGVNANSQFADNAILKFGNSGDLQIHHGESPFSPGSAHNSYIQDSGTGDLVILSNQVAIRNAAESEDMARFYSGDRVELRFNNNLKFATLGAGGTTGAAVAYGDMYATKFYGDGSNLTGIDQTTLVDANGVVRVEATTDGANITGDLSVPNGKLFAVSQTAADPAIIARNTDSPSNVIQRWWSGASSVYLEVQQPVTADEYQIVSTQQNNGIRFYNGTQGVMLLYDNEMRLQVRDSVVDIGDPNQPDVQLRVTGDITAFYSSDIRLKDDISPITKALEKVKSISGNTYTKKSDGSKHTGVIAQEIEALGLPGITTTRSSGYMAVDYEKIVPLLIEAIKELSVKVDTLEKQINN